jgi:uncharacterized SAM-binding protein YcdF (DUF218 family)
VFFFLSKVLDMLFAPLTWALLVLLWTIVKATRAPQSRDNPRKGRTPAAIVLVVLLLSSCQRTSNGLVRYLESDAIITEHKDQVYDAVILLGGLIEERATYSSRGSLGIRDLSMNENAERLTITYELLKTGRAKQVIISGGSYDAAVFHQSEADLLSERLVLWGIDPSRIIVEGKSLNTRENALYTKEVVEARKFKSLLLVTSAYHMPRSAGCFRAVGLEPDLRPVDFRSFAYDQTGSNWLPRVQYLNDTTWALRELFGRGVYRARGFSK